MQIVIRAGHSCIQTHSSAYGGKARPPRLRGFTLVELLVVLGIVAVLAALLLPTLSSARTRQKQAGCVHNLKQLTAAWQMYATDNQGRFVANAPYDETNCWAGGFMNFPLSATNDVVVREGQLFPYTRETSLYRCPADRSRALAAPRVRSYAMNGWIGSRFMETGPTAPEFRTFIKEPELAASPTLSWVIADEHEGTIDDSFFLVTMDDSRPFASFPGARHHRAFALSFADGHTEVVRFKAEGTIQADGQRTVPPDNSDWVRLKKITTAPWNY